MAQQGDTSSGKYIPGGHLKPSEVLILWFEVHILFDIYLISNMERYIDPTYIETLVESYKTRKDYSKIKSNFFFINEESDK